MDVTLRMVICYYCINNNNNFRQGIGSLGRFALPKHSRCRSSPLLPLLSILLNSSTPPNATTRTVILLYCCCSITQHSAILLLINSVMASRLDCLVIGMSKVASLRSIVPFFLDLTVGHFCARSAPAIVIPYRSHVLGFASRWSWFSLYICSDVA